MDGFRHLKRPLSGRDMFLLFWAATFFFVYPIIHADYLFFDDNSRALLLGSGVWRLQGRVLTELLYRVLTFSSATLDIFPLPLLLVLPVMSWSLVNLVQHYYRAPTFSNCLVVLPLCYSPFFLGNLTYQYDGPATVLGMSAIVFAISYRGRWSVIAPAVLVAIALAFYQVTLDVFVGLCCLEFIHDMNASTTFAQSMRCLLRRVLQLLVALMLYWGTAYQLVRTERQTLVPLDAHWLAEMLSRLLRVEEKIGLLVTHGNGWLCGLVLAFAGIGALQVGVAILKRQESVLHIALLMMVYLSAFAVLLLMVAGVVLPLQDFSLTARTLLGFSPLLVAVFYFNHRTLTQWTSAGALFLAVPLFCMLSFSYAYGRVLSAQKAFDNSVVNSMAYDFSSRAQLRELNNVYLLQPEHSALWLPAASGAMRMTPALRFVLSYDVMVIAERLPSVGIVNANGAGKGQLAWLMINNERRLLVENKFYEIYRIAGVGFIVMKKPIESETPQYHW